MILNIVAILWGLGAVGMLAFILYQFACLPVLDEVMPIPDLPPLSVIIPARNEAANIARCLASVLAQNYPDLEVVLVDDGSTDNTAAIAQATAGNDPRVKIIPAGELPDHWSGKPHACWVGALAAREASQWLLFIDADVQLTSPLALSSTVTTALTGELNLLTLLPFQELDSFWERVIFPTGLLLVLFSLNTQRINDPGTEDVVGVGQFILVHKSEYLAVGGHSHLAVRSAILEDIALARLVKGSGHRMRFMRADRLVNTRMYTNLPDMWNGFTKGIMDMFRSYPYAVLVACGALVMGWLPLILGWAAIANQSSVALTFWIIGMAALALTYVRILVYLRLPLGYGLLFPLAFSCGAAIILNGAHKRRSGNIVWRGRNYAKFN